MRRLFSGTFSFFWAIAFLVYSAVSLGYDVAKHHTGDAITNLVFGVFFLLVLVVVHLDLKRTNTVVNNVTKINVNLDQLVEAVNRLIKNDPKA